MLAWTPGRDGSAAGPVWGYVTYNGRPVKHAAIHFFPASRDQGRWAAGAIDRNGSYSIKSPWLRAEPGQVRYKICVIPNGWTPRPQPSPASESAARDDQPGSLPPQTSVPPKTAVDLEFPERFLDVQTSGLEVSLGPEPTRIDVNLKD
jgi:hypothetical protein